MGSRNGRLAALARVRELCLSLPRTSERLSQGAPSFFIAGKRMFVTFHDNHHGDGRLALWCAAAPGAQRDHVARDPNAYFVPAYVGHLGWLGVRLDRGLEWDEIGGAIEDAWLARAGARLVASVGRS
ncbi:MAG: MmcQ/YjbR family DNA-binding protein [Solirubrobacteraceae bacterium]